MNKRFLWIILLIVVIIAIFFGVSNARKVENKTAEADKSFGKTVGENVSIQAENNIENTVAINEDEENQESKIEGYVKTQLADGVLYSKDGKELKPDIVIDELYFDTTINDIWLNPDSYKDKLIEIEGMYLENMPYTFVGRYSTSSLCPNCPPGYSYFEYQLDGKIDQTFTDEKEWIKVIGKIEVGNDETTNYTDYYYLKVLSLEVMNERGTDIVNN